uniref:Sialin n=1 Tax=Parascaris equorum TaxID=6256 RepID=A0A914S3B4_PAREQ
MFTALLLCACFIALSITTSNLAGTMVLITNAIEQFPKSEVSKDDETDPAHLARSLSDNVEVRPCYEQDPSLNWTSLQKGNLLILPVSGLFCSRMDHFGGWKPTFYISAGVGCIILIIWLIFAADKPSKHFCISKKENAYILRKISEEALGKRKQRNPVPWRALLTSKPFIVAVFALVCHEYPLVIMISLLPTYLGEVLGVPDAANGFLSALPLLSLWLSKTLSSSLSSYLSARRHGCCRLDRTPLVKLFNAIASTGLGISLAIVPFLSHENEVPYAIFVMCTANAFAGLHTPGVQTALLQIAPAYTGIITGIAFSAVAIAR